VNTLSCCRSRGRGSLRVLSCVVSLIFGCAFAIVAHAEHQIDVQRRSADGDHFKALSIYELLPQRGMNYTTKIAAANSAWALGDRKKASEIFDAVLREADLNAEQRVRISLSRGIIEFQEERYQESSLFAQKAVALLKDRSPLRVRALLLLGRAQTEMKRFASAEESLTEALRDSGSSDRPEIALALANVQTKLGKLDEAQKVLKLVPASHEYAGTAVRLLSRIALLSDDTVRAKFWLDKGRTNYEESFLDSWADFSLARISLREGDLVTARGIVEAARERFPPSDRWLILMEAELEQAEWQERDKGIRK
jgi:tetratricopeptide (TPR) repeat protein